jgi:hypothetical protein
MYYQNPRQRKAFLKDTRNTPLKVFNALSDRIGKAGSIEALPGTSTTIAKLNRSYEG